jgi:hypothetical protein
MLKGPFLCTVCAAGKVQLSTLAKAEGIEEYMYEDKLEDADADGDGALLFEEFLGSYARWVLELGARY